MKREISITLAALITLSSCQTDPTMGGAVKHNIALQVVNPDPQYEEVAIEGTSGTTNQKAQERYRKGIVKQPPTIRTTTINVGGGDGGSSSGGSSGGQ